MIAPHCRAGAARELGNPFLSVKTTTTSKQAGATGGNVLMVDGSVIWRNINVMTNYACSEFGNGYWNSW